ncbi:MAG TPA: DNA-3-methyladenine glycosylase [Streptosporangiaceae bacterium]|jgi:DNA-3-methyladenine glycosylase
MRTDDQDLGGSSAAAAGKPGCSAHLPPSPLPRVFFDRPALAVAPEVLGCVLWHASPDGTVAAVITEVEAYAGQADPASHAFRGQTARNAVMFGPPGHAYVYFTYGMHFCVNLVCEPAGKSSAVLLRAGRVIEGAELAAARRLRSRAAGGAGAGPGIADRDLARGPARLCQALGIDRSLDGADVCAADSPLGVGTPPGWAPAAADAISTGPRVGISQAAEVPWRFWLAGEPSVSSYRRSAPRRGRAKPVTGPAPADGTMLR